MKTPVRTRLLSALLSLVMLVSLLPVSVFAAEPEAGTWTKVELADITADDTVAITMTKGDSTWVLPNNGDAKARGQGHHRYRQRQYADHIGEGPVRLEGRQGR